MAASTQPAPNSNTSTYAGFGVPLILPAWVIIGFFLVLPVGMMLIYSFLTKEFRGGVIWEFSMAAYDQFFFDRGLFGDEAPKIEWTYITIFWRSIWQAAVRDGILPDYRLSNSLVHRNARRPQSFHLAFPYHNPLLGESADPHDFDEIPDPR